VQTGATKTFTASGRMTDGSTASVPVRFTATGGTITSGGVYTAGSTAGSYRVVATDTSGAFADTSSVSVTAPAPTLAAIVLTPASVSLQTGATQQFSASGRMSDGSTASVTVGFSATGGTISPSGLYTAGQNGGGFRVIATLSGGSLADTAAVTVSAPPPPPPPSTGCQGVGIAAGASIQSAVNANGTGTTFCLSAGTYGGQSISPKAGQRFIGARDASGARLTVLDGQNSVAYAFNSSAGDVVIQGVVVRNYATPQQQSAVFGYNATGWRVLDNELTANAAAGTNAATNWIVRGNWIHHNGQLGVHPQSNTSGAVVDSNEISYNNTAGFDPYWEAGGIKGVLTTNLTIRGNWVHHNSGFGIWCDNCSATTRYEGNRVEDNTHAGIYHEVSADAVIVGNTCLRNGINTSRGGIWVDNSANVEISGNVLDANGDGIKLRQVSRPDLPNRILQNAWVHDNTVTLTRGTIGVVQYVSDNSYFSSKNIRFTNNHYTLTPSAPFAWNNTTLTLSQWNVAGQQ
jgi:parallel beta-helix repeat protein